MELLDGRPALAAPPRVPGGRLQHWTSAESTTGWCDKARSVTEGDGPVGKPVASPARTLRHNRRASRRAKAGGALGGVARGGVERLPGSARAGNWQGESYHHRRHGNVKRPRRGDWRTQLSR
jgi:hypothetical protein